MCSKCLVSVRNCRVVSQEAHKTALAEMENMVQAERARYERSIEDTAAEKRAIFEAKQMANEQLIVERTVAAQDRILLLKKDTINQTKAEERQFVARATMWLSTSQRKVELKQQEDSEAAELAKKKKKRK